MSKQLSIIIPSFNNPQYLNPCIDSIIRTGILQEEAELIIINNGKQPIREYVQNVPNIRVLEPGINLGWEKGLELGIQESDSPFLCFQNDDTNIPPSSRNFYGELMAPFLYQDVAAVGPSTTIASGWHSIYLKNPLTVPTEVSYLIFFAVMIRRSHLIEVGGIDTSAPGGDDFDLCIRFRNAGKKLVLNPNAFIIHHAFKTGERVRGNSDKTNGWNSKEMTDQTNQWLIQKHGFKTFMKTRMGLAYDVPTSASHDPDTEGQCIRERIPQEFEKIVDLGCGTRRTHPKAVCYDQLAKGIPVPNVYPPGLSIADIVCDVSKELPIESDSQDAVIARHVIEHVPHTRQTLKEWMRILKHNGLLYLAVPDDDLGDTLHMDHDHKHAFTKTSMTEIMESMGWKTVDLIDPKNGVSFVGIWQKNGSSCLE